MSFVFKLVIAAIAIVLVFSCAVAYMRFLRKSLEGDKMDEIERYIRDAKKLADRFRQYKGRVGWLRWPRSRKR